MFDKLKQFLTGERIEGRYYPLDMPFEEFIEDINSHAREGEELTELEFFDESGKRIQHWKKYK